MQAPFVPMSSGRRQARLYMRACSVTAVVHAQSWALDSTAWTWTTLTCAVSAKGSKGQGTGGSVWTSQVGAGRHGGHDLHAVHCEHSVGICRV